jgi:hypothetical protein
MVGTCGPPPEDAVRHGRNRDLNSLDRTKGLGGLYWGLAQILARSPALSLAAYGLAANDIYERSGCLGGAKFAKRGGNAGDKRPYRPHLCDADRDAET